MPNPRQRTFCNEASTADWGEGPYPVPYADFENPQTLNLYGYAGNNPISRRDADGHVTCDPDTVTYGPNGVTVTAGACHFDALDYVRLSYYAFQGLNQSLEQQAAQNRRGVLQDLKSLDSFLAAALIGPPCNCGDDEKNDQQSSSNKSASRMTNKEAKEAAKKLGYDREVKDPPFDSRGNKVFTDGKNYITADRDMHSGGVWKMFDASANRLGTYDANLNRIGN